MVTNNRAMTTMMLAVLMFFAGCLAGGGVTDNADGEQGGDTPPPPPGGTTVVNNYYNYTTTNYTTTNDGEPPLMQMDGTAATCWRTHHIPAADGNESGNESNGSFPDPGSNASDECWDKVDLFLTTNTTTAVEIVEAWGYFDIQSNCTTMSDAMAPYSSNEQSDGFLLNDGGECTHYVRKDGVGGSIFSSNGTHVIDYNWSVLYRLHPVINT